MIARFRAWFAGIGASIIAAGAVLLYLFGSKAGKRSVTMNRLKENIDIINKKRTAEEALLSEAESSADHARQAAANSAAQLEADRSKREKDIKDNPGLDAAMRRADAADRRWRERNNGS